MPHGDSGLALQEDSNGGQDDFNLTFYEQVKNSDQFVRDSSFMDLVRVNLNSCTIHKLKRLCEECRIVPISVVLTCGASRLILYIRLLKIFMFV